MGRSSGVFDKSLLLYEPSTTCLQVVGSNGCVLQISTKTSEMADTKSTSFAATRVHCTTIVMSTLIMQCQAGELHVHQSAQLHDSVTPACMSDVLSWQLSCRAQGC